MVDRFVELETYLGIDQSTARLYSRDEARARAAVAVTLLSAALSDRVFERTEGRVIAELLQQNFGVTALRALEVQSAALVEAERAALDGLLRIVRDEISVSERSHVLEQAWRVLLSDGRLDPGEGEFARHLRDALGLSMEQAAHARAVVEGKWGEGPGDPMQRSAKDRKTKRKR